MWQLSKAWSEDPQFQGHVNGPFKAKPTPAGTNFSVFQSINVIDLQNKRGTLVPTRGIAAPATDLNEVKKILDVNYLTEGR